jgi:hypothetical protein
VACRILADPEDEEAGAEVGRVAASVAGVLRGAEVEECLGVE